ncbi:restriction endonuclease subunit S [Shouchella clausii]|uniref:restriction endonuclease subunit S n=1 Tax=Shouchella clausii TaxID=79880 RepID=UPI000BA75155|nr:restriction endonuclease subunit S [Shouchella clausii]MEB5478284.1 restriction endonuclease subunit S [Shouchella clausii]MED4159364.1 restriction endonuclease subunit S [Shouchella clausii]MED4176020.1 restriction endonuclease subunit S [Shouchella clausii]PAD15765.1 hypothetical protein CHH74_05735 [Shouchella clausii]PAE97925.1 hypothetical protein CHH71_07405 [Shouchella clausii]
MAKKKKTMEELLEEALVPEEEQPYEVPGNWVWTRIGNIFTQVKEQIKPNGTESYIGLEQLLKGGGITESASSKGIKSNKVVFKKNDVLYGKLRPYLNKHAIVNFDGVASTDILVYRSNSKFRNLLLNYYLGLPMVVSYANENSNGINLPRVSPMTMNLLPFPLPPLNEQKRIADKVERLLNKIDEAKRLIEEAKESFELRRAAILDKAFRGELTKGGRVQNLDNDDKDIPSSWRWIKLKDVLEMQNGLSKRSGKAGTSVPVLRLADIRGNEFGENELRNILLTDKELEKYSLEDNDILFIRVNGSKKSVGKAINYNLGGKMAFCDHLIRARFDIRTIDPLYIVYLFESELIREQLNQKIVSSAGQNTISQGSLNELMLPLPPKQEIDIIVSEIQSLFEKEQMVMSLIEKEINLDTLKQSILSKAFKGQLGTNDPTEENAIELLKEVLQEKL